MSNVLMRSTGGTKSAEPCLVMRETKSRMPALTAPSFQEGRDCMPTIVYHRTQDYCKTKQVSNTVNEKCPSVLTVERSAIRNNSASSVLFWEAWRSGHESSAKSIDAGSFQKKGFFAHWEQGEKGWI